jgi:hypothetical protein
MGRRRARRKARADFQLKAKIRQVSKLEAIRQALVAAGYHTIGKQAAMLGVGRSTAWAVFNCDTRIGPSANVIKRILSSPHLPPTARRKVEEYVEERISGLYGHTKSAKQWDRDDFLLHPSRLTKREAFVSLGHERPLGQ